MHSLRPPERVLTKGYNTDLCLDHAVATQGWQPALDELAQHNLLHSKTCHNINLPRYSMMSQQQLHFAHLARASSLERLCTHFHMDFILRTAYNNNVILVTAAMT